jgi:hypothetical protein
MKFAPMNSQRRTLLKAAQGAGLLAAAAALLGGRYDETPVSPADAAPPDANGKRGYYETDHIRKYYATARYF